MHAFIEIGLADIPEWAHKEYHPDQVRLYAKLAETMYQGLNLPSIMEFMGELAETLNLEIVTIRVLRIPSRRSSIEPLEGPKGTGLKGWVFYGKCSIEEDLIEVYPIPLWPDKLVRPSPGLVFVGSSLDSLFRTLIHEMLHLSGMRDEAETERLMDQHYEHFRRAYLPRFGEEFKPLYKEWEKMAGEFGLY